jgi:hypothetical protein
MEKSSPKIWALLVNKKVAQENKRPIRQKFAQSSDPDLALTTFA